MNIDSYPYPLHYGVIASAAFAREALLIQMKNQLDSGADVNQLDSTRSTALGYCVQIPNQTPIKYKKDIILLLLQYKADPNFKDTKEWTLLHHAAWNGDLEFIQLCVKHGRGDVNSLDKEGSKPVDVAAIRGHTHVMNYLDTQSADLRCVCRKVIRETMGKTSFPHLHLLPLPPQVKLFLSYHIPYPGFTAVLMPPAPWSKDELWRKEVKADKIREFIQDHASSEFVKEHSCVLNVDSMDKDDDDDLIKLFQELYLWESFKTVDFEEPLAREPRYSLTKLKKSDKAES